MLPKLNGYKVAQRLRDEEIWTPILMLTAKDGEYDEAEALDIGADDYLRKPFAWVVLIARLTRYCVASPPNVPPNCEPASCSCIPAGAPSTAARSSWT